MKSTLIVTVLLAAALTSAGALPAAAEKNNGAFNQSAEGNKPSRQLCEAYRHSFLDFGHAADTATSNDAQTYYNSSAIEYAKEAKKIGCGWPGNNALNPEPKGKA